MTTGRKTILITDDIAGARKLLSTILREAGYNTHTEARKEDALIWAIKNKPHLIISDITSPGMNGVEFTYKLKENKSTQSIPILIVSGCSDMRKLIEVKDAGANDFLSKPYDRHELIAAAHHLVL